MILRPGVAVFESRAAARMSSAVLWSGRRATLVDPGILPDELASIDAFLVERRLEVERVVLTHCHWDHVAGAGRFAAPVVAHPAFARWLVAIEAEEPAQVGLQRAYDREDLGAAPLVSVPAPSVLAGDGERVGELTAVHLPGHTGDGLGVVFEDTLVCGDILDSLELPLPLHDLDAYLGSLSTIERLLGVVATVVPGHGPALSAGQAGGQLAQDRDYLERLDALAREAVARGFDAEWPPLQAMAHFGKGDPDRDSEHRLVVGEVWKMRAGVDRGVPG